MLNLHRGYEGHVNTLCELLQGQVQAHLFALAIIGGVFGSLIGATLLAGSRAAVVDATASGEP